MFRKFPRSKRELRIPMSRIPYPDISALPDKVQRMIAGTPLNVVRMGAHASPSLFEAQGALGYAIARPDVLDPRLREVVILVVAHLSGSTYELHQHLPLARQAGLSDADLAAIEAENYERLEPRLAIVARFTAETVRHVSPSDATLAELRGEVTDQVLVNVVLTIGCYMSLARLIAVTGIEPDEHRLAALPTGPGE
jgi:alkylhydroperoxidase family enzyme